MFQGVTAPSVLCGFDGNAAHCSLFNYAGLILILLGIALLIGEAFMPSFGILGIGGVYSSCARFFFKPSIRRIPI